MTGRVRKSWWRRLFLRLDDWMPMSPDERQQRDDDGTDKSEARKQRLKFHMLEKRGKGGYR